MYYPKINGPFHRHTSGPDKNKLILDRWSEQEFEYLANNEWYWLEKLDGTNTIVKWDGNEVTFHGRGPTSDLPKPLIAHYKEKYTPELLRNVFGEDLALVYMEGVGPKIQKGGGMYGESQHGVVIDVRVGDWWLLRYAVHNVAHALDTPWAPMVGSGTFWEAVDVVSNGFKSTYDADRFAEGLVIRPIHDLQNRAGKRITTKIKHVDFYKGG